MALTVDASTPARVDKAGTGSAVSTTATFDPPAALLVACCSGDGSAQTFTMTNNGTGLTWTEIRLRNSADPGGESSTAQAFQAVLTAARTGMTVTATYTQANDTSFKVYVITGADAADPVGGTAEGSTIGSPFTTASFTTESGSSLGFIVLCDFDALGVISATGTTMDTSTITGQITAASGYKTLGAAGFSASFDVTAGGAAPTLNYVTFEIEPAGGAADRTATDTAIVSDSAARAATKSRTTTDTTTAGDTANRGGLTRSRTTTDIAPAVDITTRAVQSYFRSATDTATAGDVTSAAGYAPSTAIIPNPERGFFQFTETHYDPDQTGHVALSSSTLATGRNTNSRTLVFRYYVIERYLTLDTIDAAYLTLLSNDFAAVRTAGCKVIPRFAYSTSGDILPPYNADPPVARVLGHIGQLASTINANADVIDTIEVGFIGMWGEWYYTDNFGDVGVTTEKQWADRVAVLNAMYDAFDSRIYLAVRYPGIKKAWLG